MFFHVSYSKQHTCPSRYYRFEGLCLAVPNLVHWYGPVKGALAAEVANKINTTMILMPGYVVICIRYKYICKKYFSTLLDLQILQVIVLAHIHSCSDGDLLLIITCVLFSSQRTSPHMTWDTKVGLMLKGHHCIEIFYNLHMSQLWIGIE